MWELFDSRVVEPGRLPLFCFFVSFILTFLFTRIGVRLIRAEHGRRWLRNVVAGDVHIHHVVFGVVLMLCAGIASFSIPEEHRAAYTVAASLFGIGAALVLDEFALILHLRDVYWTEEGRTSVDAVFVAIALTGLLLLGVRPVGLAVFAGTEQVRTWLYVLSLALNLALAVVCLLKGKIWTGLTGLFLPLLPAVGAVRLARPGSPWARWLYTDDPGRQGRALRRELLLRHPPIQAKIRLQELIAGRHDLLDHEPESSASLTLAPGNGWKQPSTGADWGR
ncbi:hypothetical protein ABGB12_23990 [Actinocorallia sp. B10E7]|uniref:hypothetical protein n=1 Tax=Actinocorallia sp. B10E7 TaxID=3153558 RepID=UPI00325DE2DF